MLHIGRAAAYAELYQLLAEVLAEPPEWFSAPGRQWPLYSAANKLASHSADETLHQIIAELEAIPPETSEARLSRYRALFSAGEVRGLWLYESLWRDGRLLGPTTFAAWRVYETVGLTTAGTELPDHVSIELAFLAYLAEQESQTSSDAGEWRKARHLFIQRHASQWLPSLGHAIVQTKDEVYKSIGWLLIHLFEKKKRLKRKSLSNVRPLPRIAEPKACNLCSFCVQVCPTKALVTREDDDTSALQIMDSLCSGCSKCVRTCPTGALHLIDTLADDSWQTLRTSLRVHCPHCGEPTVSQAEFEAVCAQIGEPEWLRYCLDCRSVFLSEKSHALSR